MKKLFATVFIVAVLSGCQTEAKFQRNMDSWMGKNIDSLIDSWGYPSNEMTAPNGNRVYVYSNSGTFVTPTDTTYNTIGNVYGNRYSSTTYATTTGGYPITFSCAVFVEFNRSGTIDGIRWKGNNCKSY
ncbi:MULTISPECIES: lipoprotein [Providencia]|uniref:lipoprotein n=1 Tax=Providencia TaxID=586 RepID=UPI0019802C5C|nr:MULTISPECIES: lipoprotein [Providencia]MBN4863279.1 hypothetical protein [Providencia stuartii]MBN4876462.1 hypothetical protein [Providencia stuartii]MBN4878278.1 hypothetical protein [Providencia stuartii]MBN4881802.1 hypothetical protein [Providencia stuartii]